MAETPPDAAGTFDADAHDYRRSYVQNGPYRAERDAAGIGPAQARIDELERRLAAAEQVCVLVGCAGIRDQTDPLHRAITQAWLDWSHLPDVRQPDMQAPEWQARIQDLANRRTATRTLTLARLQDLIDEGDDDGVR